MDEQSYFESEVDSWCDAVAGLNDYRVIGDQSQHHIEQTVGNEMSRWGYLDAPMNVLLMISNASKLATL